MHCREKLVSEALRPAAASALWKDRLNDSEFAKHADTAMKTIMMVEAASAEEEALAIAVALRETVEDPERTAALVTPDVGLGRRVTAALARWNVAVDDFSAAFRSLIRWKVFSRGLQQKWRLAALRRCPCWRWSNIPRRN